jgi:hypothetical protein
MEVFFNIDAHVLYYSCTHPCVYTFKAYRKKKKPPEKPMAAHLHYKHIRDKFFKEVP